MTHPLDSLPGLPRVSRETRDRLDLLVQELERWQRVKNLVGPRTLADVWKRHVADSLQLLTMAPSTGVWADLGTGAGFPGLVIAIARLETCADTVHLVESNDRKCAFLRHVVRLAGLPVQVHAARMEDVLPKLDPRPEIVSARALAPLEALLTATQSLLMTGAVGIFPKGEDVETELTEAARHWRFHVARHASLTSREGCVLVIRDLRPVAV
jgi:16S rRNA (guanine527-N7)-methyltransferase